MNEESQTSEKTELETVRCEELIDSWTHLSEKERTDLKNELPTLEHSLCPNMTDFMVMGGYWGRTWIELEIYPKDDAPYYDGWFTVY